MGEKKTRPNPVRKQALYIPQKYFSSKMGCSMGIVKSKNQTKQIPVSSPVT